MSAVPQDPIDGPPSFSDLALSEPVLRALADAVEGVGQSSAEARKAAAEYARNWSMDALAERYVDVYRRAIAAYDARH